MTKKDYYEILGLTKPSTEKEIKNAYRRLAKKYHPDTAKGKTAEERFKEITEAYEVLSNKKKKALYDKYGFAPFENGFDPDFEEKMKAAGAHYSDTFGSGGFGSRDFSGRGGQSFHFEGSDDMNDILRGMFGDFGAGHGFGSFRQSRTGGFHYEETPEKGADAEAYLTLTLEEAAFGCDKRVTLRDEHGSFRTVETHIPEGIDDGQTVRLKGQGSPGYSGGPAGDLLLRIHVRPKAGFERKGADLYVTAFIPYIDAVLGGEATIPTLTGKVSCKIPAGTKCGSKIRLRGKGLPDRKHPGQTGDEYVIIQIEVPTGLSAGAKEKLRECFRVLT